VSSGQGEKIGPTISEKKKIRGKKRRELQLRWRASLSARKKKRRGGEETIFKAGEPEGRKRLTKS